MKTLDQYDDINDAVADWLDYVSKEDYENKWPLMAEQFKKIDEFRVAEVILGYLGFSEEVDHDRMKTFLVHSDYGVHAVMPNVPIKIPMFNSDTLSIITEDELLKLFNLKQVNIFRKYKDYFNIKWNKKL